MKIIKAKYILLCNEEFNILEDKAISFNRKIVDIGELKELKKKYPQAEIEEYKNALLMPSLINPHIHLEFSSNKTSLEYGDFLTWLKSVIFKQKELFNKNLEESMQKGLEEITRSGVGAFGEISSSGLDLKICVEAKQKVIFFNEILGSDERFIEERYRDFSDRLKKSKEFKSDRFYPAISIHSPYTTHKSLIEKAIKIAKEENFIVSTHFMESLAEREWLDRGEGDFKPFFQKLFSSDEVKPANKPLEYLENFRGVKTLFTHLVYANSKEIEKIKEIGGVATHCPISNRLLGNKLLNLSHFKEWTLATDGLSSNYSLNIWNELRIALFLHNSFELNQFAKELLLSVTKNSAKALNLESGEIKIGNFADLALFNLPDRIENLENLATQLILHTSFVKRLYIDGELIKK